MGDFKAVTEKFYVRLLSDGGYGSERVVCQVGLEGLQITAVDTGRTLRKYPLNHIARWAAQGTSLMLYTKTPSDVEERTLTLQADETTIRSLLDTLTCCCMQMAELLTSNEQRTSGGAGPSSNPLNNKKQQHQKALPSADEVEFWKDPEKAGWMHSQGEHIKTWRRRWFILKQGYLYRFASNDVNASSKPRGVVDLSKVTDVGDGRGETGRPNSLKLATAAGKVCYVCDTETELVEWMSALEGAVNKLVRRAAGVDDEPATKAPQQQRAQPDWARQLESSFSDATASAPRRTSSASQQQLPPRTTAQVTIVGYGNDAPARPVEDFNYGGLNYSSIAGVAGVADYQPSNGHGGANGVAQEPLLHVDYAAYPVPPVVPSADAAGGDAYAPQYGHYMQQLTQPPAQAEPAYGGDAWQVHYTAEGRAYYHNAATGITQWEAPAGMA